MIFVSFARHIQIPFNDNEMENASSIRTCVGTNADRLVCDSKFVGVLLCMLFQPFQVFLELFLLFCIVLGWLADKLFILSTENREKKCENDTQRKKKVSQNAQSMYCQKSLWWNQRRKKRMIWYFFWFVCCVPVYLVAGCSIFVAIFNVSNMHGLCFELSIHTRAKNIQKPTIFFPHWRSFAKTTQLPLILPLTRSKKNNFFSSVLLS